MAKLGMSSLEKFLQCPPTSPPRPLQIGQLTHLLHCPLSVLRLFPLTHHRGDLQTSRQRSQPLSQPLSPLIAQLKIPLVAPPLLLARTLLNGPRMIPRICHLIFRALSHLTLPRMRPRTDQATGLLIVPQKNPLIRQPNVRQRSLILPLLRALSPHISPPNLQLWNLPRSPRMFLRINQRISQRCRQLLSRQVTLLTNHLRHQPSTQAFPQPSGQVHYQRKGQLLYHQTLHRRSQLKNQVLRQQTSLLLSLRSGLVPCQAQSLQMFQLKPPLIIQRSSLPMSRLRSLHTLPQNSQQSDQRTESAAQQRIPHSLPLTLQVTPRLTLRLTSQQRIQRINQLRSPASSRLKCQPRPLALLHRTSHLLVQRRNPLSRPLNHQVWIQLSHQLFVPQRSLLTSPLRNQADLQPSSQQTSRQRNRQMSPLRSRPFSPRWSQALAPLKSQLFSQRTSPPTRISHSLLGSPLQLLVTHRVTTRL
jgi:hypothetical protein